MIDLTLAIMFNWGVFLAGFLVGVFWGVRRREELDRDADNDPIYRRRKPKLRVVSSERELRDGGRDKGRHGEESSGPCSAA